MFEEQCDEKDRNKSFQRSFISPSIAGATPTKSVRASPFNVYDASPGLKMNEEHTKTR